jgi:glycosyltransferase involved in cell wall biosynthesis
MITEGTYPYAVGGVSSWCDALISGAPETAWEILPIVAGGKRLRPSFTLPPNARLARPIELWSETPSLSPAGRPIRSDGESIPARLLRGLMPWRGDLEGLTAALLSCRRGSRAVRREFRSRTAWQDYLQALMAVLTDPNEASAPAPIYDTLEAARLYQTLYWVAQTAAVPTPECSLLHVTAAGWSAIPAIVHKQLHSTPLLLTEHGVYVREAYLASIRQLSGSPARRHMATHLALGLTRAAYAAADVVAPVTEANAAWERSLGVEPKRITVIPNGIRVNGPPTPASDTKRVVAIGRIDPLKDVQTMLLVADEVTRWLPDARFEYWGPVTAGEQNYSNACQRLHAQLELGDRFRFMGSTGDPQGVIRSADVVLMTSISEAMPMTLLETMAQGRPAVATSVGGVSSVLRGCGLVAAPGDVLGLSAAVATLLRSPRLAAQLGQRGYERLLRHYTLERCVASYRELIGELTAP